LLEDFLRDQRGSIIGDSIASLAGGNSNTGGKRIVEMQGYFLSRDWLSGLKRDLPSPQSATFVCGVNQLTAVLRKARKRNRGVLIRESPSRLFLPVAKGKAKNSD
jgi:hypothetical protein